MRVLRFQRWTKSEYAFSIVLVVSKLSFAVLKHPTYTSLLASGVSMVRISWIAKDARQALRSRNVMQTGKADGTHNQTAWNRPSSPLLIACCLVAGYPSLAPFKKCGGIAQHGFHLRVTFQILPGLLNREPAIPRSRVIFSIFCETLRVACLFKEPTSNLSLPFSWAKA